MSEEPGKRAEAGTRRVAQVSVIGTGDCEWSSESARLAEEVGRRLAEAVVSATPAPSARR